jgi:predicted HAD superfamily Cof-like phosphohydrolase
MKTIYKKLADITTSMFKSKYAPFISEVEEFNTMMGKSNNYSPVIPEEKEWMFVYNFVLEELEEFKHACETGDIVEVLDALCDLQYVSGGNGVMLFGLKDRFMDAYAEVQASNLSKICMTEEDAIETVKLRAEQQGESCHYEKVGEGYVVYRSSDRKVMKSLKYFRPNLHQFFTQDEINNCKLNTKTK